MIPDYADTGLPYPQRDGYGLKKVNKIRTTDMDVGRAVQRWEFDDAPAYVTANFNFTAPESRLFNAWVNQVVKAGWFSMPLLTDMGFDVLVVRFTETPPSTDLVARFAWKWTTTLEVEFEPMLDEGWAEVLPEYILDASIFDIAMNKKWPLNPWARYADYMDNAINQDWPQP